MSANKIIINCRCLFYKFGLGGSDYLEKQSFRVKVDVMSILKLEKVNELIW